MTELETAFDTVATDLRADGDPERAAQMQAYMKDHFEFLGVPSPARKRIQKPLLAAARSAAADDLLDLADRCWACDEREFQYIATDALRARARSLGPEHLPRVRQLIETKSWWDTVDSLAAHTVGIMVRRHPELVDAMDRWIDDPNIWVARTAILHQLTFKHEVDEARLYAYALARADDSEFFIRKALGWALRNHARFAPDSVRTFVETHHDRLSGLTRREATKHL